MDFIDQIKALASRIPKQIDVIRTEEATKNAFIMPFIAALGYNVFDPSEVVPEFTADVGLKKGEKVDYAIQKEGKSIILFECKHHGANLDIEHASQLYRYFHVTEAKIGVLTNGIIYKFFTDLDETNKMDSKPFLELNMLDLKDVAIDELKRFTKTAFSIDEIVTAASELKYTREVKKILAEEFLKPSDDFVKYFASRVHEGKVTQKILEKYAEFTKRALHQFVNDKINDRLKQAMSAESPESISPAVASVVDAIANVEDGGLEKIITTEEELEAYHIIKAILREVIEPKRVALRDNQSYAGILLDDNNRKPICRLRFNNANKSIGIFNADKTEEKIPIQDLNQIFGLADKLKLVVKVYEDPAFKKGLATAGERDL